MGGEFSALSEQEEAKRIGRRIIPGKPPQKTNWKPKVASWLQIILFFMGIICVTVGFGLWSLPLGLVICGIFLIGLAFLMIEENNEPSR